jgi:hypothetical protein
VPVLRLDQADVGAGLREERQHRPIVVDQGFVDAAGEEDLLLPGARRLAELVDESDHRIEQRTTAVLADVGEGEGAGLEQEFPEVSGTPPGGVQAGHAPEAGAHQPAVAGVVQQGELLLQQR